MFCQFQQYKRYVIVALCSGIIMTACGTKSPESGQAVARVGYNYISVKDFKQNYEFGFSNLKHGPDPKRTYLEYMIREKLLALEGMQQGLHKSNEVEEKRAILRNELMIEALLYREVRSKIKVSEAEIRQEIIESRVLFKFRYYLADNPNEAAQVSEVISQEGFSAVKDQQDQQSGESPAVSKIQISEYVTRGDIPEAVFSILKDLPVGQISGPVELDGKYAVIQMLDIQRKAILEGDFKSKAAAVEQQLFYKKYDKAISEYLDKLLTPKNIVTSGKMFGMLCKAVLEWKNERKHTTFMEAVESGNESKPGLSFLNVNPDQIFVSFDNGSLSVDQLLRQLNFNYLPNKSIGEQDILQAIDEMVKLSIRDYFLLAEADRLKIQLPLRLDEELTKWTEKWTYQALSKLDAGHRHISVSELQAYFNDHKDTYQSARTDTVHLEDVKYLVERDYHRKRTQTRMDSLVRALYKKYEVEIYSEVLDTVQVSSSDKSKWMTFQAYKAGTGRLAWPSVDPAWAEFSKNGVNNLAR